MRKKIIAGNWKMNKTHHEGMEFLLHLFKRLDMEESLLEDSPKDSFSVGVDTQQSGKSFPEIVIAPPYLLLPDAVMLAQGWDMKIAAQNCSSEKKGAYTGEISASMLKAINVDYVIIGHSERRTCFYETNEIIARKVSQAIENNLSVILCIGETLQEREAGKEFQVIAQQLEECLAHPLTPSQREGELNPTSPFLWEGFRMGSVVLAYEPVWAIGTGRNAIPEQVQQMHHYIRKIISEKYGKEFSENTSILYGGSCNPENARSIFSQSDVDGGLIGGASLIARDFVEVIKAMTVVK